MNKDVARERILAIRMANSLNATIKGKMADALLECGQMGRMPNGAMLFAEGDMSDDTGIVLLDGEVSVIKEGTPEIIAVAPEILGEMAPQSPQKQRTATVTATTEIAVLRFRWSDFGKAAQRAMSEEEFEALKQALQNVAWEHFTY